MIRTSGIAEKLGDFAPSRIDEKLGERPVTADGGYRGNPQVIMPYRKLTDGSDLSA